jgi:chromate reductase
MKLLGISGSLRAGSYNTLLVRAAAAEFGEADFEMADLRLPLYDADLEAQGMPESVTRLREQVVGADAIVISGPEYNAGISGVLKNALDWISRIPPMAFAGKPVAIMSAAAGRSGGERTQVTLRHCLVNFGPRLIQQPQVMLANPDAAFTDGELTDERYRKAVAALMASLRAEAERG